MSDLRCYCCGQAIGDRFSLVSMSKESDRVFVMTDEHVAKAEDAVVVVKVERR